MNLFALLLFLGAADCDATADLARIAETAPRPYEVLAVARTESTWDYERVSTAGACGMMQTLGGRYGMPGCDLIRADHRLDVLLGLAHLRYWRRNCGAAYLDAYNGGWSKCWTRRIEATEWCRESVENMNVCQSYSRKVRALERRYRRMR